MALRKPFLAILLVLLTTATLPAQDSAEKKPATSKAVKGRPAKSEEADAIAAQRNVVAISLLTTLADEARSFRDQALRARVEARTADAFWETDREKARQLFRRAWEEADAADAEAARRQAEEAAREAGTGRPNVRRRPRDLRSEVLRLVAKRDKPLAEELLKKLTEADERERNEATSKRNEFDNTPASISKRIQLARRLLEDGEVEKAIEFAMPVLDSVNNYSINFLSALREKNAKVADQAFLSLLARAARDTTSDANTVSGLSSYAFTPFLYVQFSRTGGGNVSQERRDVPAPELTAAVRNAFFRVASEILMRPLAQPDQDQTTSGRTGKYLIIKRLLPLFEQHAPEQAPILRTQMAALSSEVPPDFRTGENRSVTRGIVPDDMVQNPLERMQQRLDRARTTQERDAIYADYAVSLGSKGDPKARELIDKIDDAALRKSVRGYIDFEEAQRAINNKDATEAARIAKNGELTSVQRIWIYARAARMQIKVDQTKAMEWLDEAVGESRRMSGSSPDRTKGLVAVATVLGQVDRVRAWEIAAEALKAANGTEGYSGEDSTVVAILQTSQMVVVTNAGAEEFDLLGLFRFLAKDDLNRAVELAKGFTAEGPRAVATLAIARTVLEKPATETTSLE